ncbi:MAG: lipopolysaccharide biosynthesis protein, partial [Nocardioides sp.]
LSLLAIALALVLLPVTSALVGDSGQLVAAFCLGLAGYASCFAIRGDLSGRNELGRYGRMLWIEGVVRLLGLGSLAALDLVSLAACGWLFALAPWVAAVLSVARAPRARAPRARSTKPDGARARLVAPILLLIPGALAAQLLVNAGPLVVSLLATPAERGQAGVLLAALVLIRVPVFLFTAVQPTFLPAMSLHAANDRPDLFLRLLWRVLAVMVLFTVLSSLVMTTLGPLVVTLLFGFEEELGRSAFLLLTVAAGLFLIAMVLAQSLIGLGRHAATTVGWLTGIAGLVVGTTLSEDLVTQASLAFLAGAVVATVAMAVQLWLRIRMARSPGHTGTEVAPRRS